MTIAFSYIRFSSAQQAQGDSLRRQTQLAVNYCRKHNLTLSETNYQDLGVSAFNSANAQEDSGLGQFIAALDQNAIPKDSYLLVESLDRLSRAKVQTALRQMLHILEYGITIVTLMDERTYSKESESIDLIISLTIMERAHNESKTKSDRIKAAWENKRQNPNTTDRHSSTPFWLALNSDKRTYTILEDKANIVKKIYQLSIDGWGITKIVRYLNDNDIAAPKGGSWATTTVNRILNSKAVLGHYEPTKGRKSLNTIINNYYPEIIDDNTYYISQRRKHERSTPEAAGRKTEFPNPLNQIAKCKLCGSSMYYDNKSSSLKYLTCREFKKKNCVNKPIRMELIYAFIQEVFNTPMYHQHHATLVSKNKLKINTHLASLEGELREVQEDLRALLSAVSGISNTLVLEEIKTRSERLNNLEIQIEKAKAEKASEQDQNVHINFREATQLTVNALQRPFARVYPQQLTQGELFNVRVKLNRVLKQAFGTVSIHHDKESKLITINTNIFNYQTSSSDIKKLPYSPIWYVCS